MPLHRTTLKIETGVYLSIEQKKSIRKLHSLNIPQPEGVILECLEHDFQEFVQDCKSFQEALLRAERFLVILGMQLALCLST